MIASAYGFLTDPVLWTFAVIWVIAQMFGAGAQGAKTRRRGNRRR